MRVLIMIAKGFAAFLISAALVFVVMFMLIGAVMGMVSIVTDMRITEYEAMALLAVIALSGAIGMMLTVGKD